MSGREAADAALMRPAVEADLVRLVSILHAPPVGTVHTEGDLVWFETGRPSQYLNGILRSPLVLGDADIARALEVFRHRRLPMMWWFFTGLDGMDAGTADRLVGQGLKLNSDRPGMALALSDLRKGVAPQGASVQRVQNEKDFEGWTAVVNAGFGAPALEDSPSSRSFRRIGFDDDSPFRHFICRVDGEPVAAVVIMLTGRFAGVSNMAALPDQRRKGYGRFVLSHALAEVHRKEGADVAVLTADEAGAGLYRSLGFTTICRHLTYVWAPPD
jgi:ribosomal protein S18 acetylase RimI-like enzyme